MAIYITGTLVSGQLNYNTGDSESVRADLNLSVENVVYTTGNQNISGIKTFINQTNVSGVKFDILTPEQIPSYEQGMVFYSDDYHTLNIYPDVPGLSLQVGQENWVRVKNGLPQTVNIGSVVYITGTNGVNPGFQLSIAANEGGSARTLGVVANTMTPNNPGYVTTFGVVNGIDTRSYSVGQTLYLSSTASGQFSSIKPTAPNHMVRIGTVLTSKMDGSIFVTVQNGFELDELHDVSINGKVSGNFIKYNGSLWNNSDITLNDITDSSSLVYLTGNQTISGVKNFTQRPTLNGVGFLLSGEAGSGDYYPNNNPSGFITNENLTASGYVTSNITNINGATKINNMMQITQAGYNAITPAVNTLYVIVG